MRKATIVGINGSYVPVPGEPNQNCVDLLERLLADAQAGNLHSVAVVTGYNDGARWALVGSSLGFDVIGGLEMVKRSVQERMS